MLREKKVAGIYNKIAKDYFLSRTLDTKARIYHDYLEKPALKSVVGGVKNKRVLDLGCGPGILTDYFRRKGAKISGVDISKKEIEIARSEFKGIDFKVASAYKLPYPPNTFDMVISSWVIHYLDLDRALKEVRRVLKKGGFLVFSTNNPLQEVTQHKKRLPRFIREFHDYFKEGVRSSYWWGYDGFQKVNMPYIHLTYETLIRNIIKRGFTITDYVDARPLGDMKRLDKDAYEYLSRVPNVCVFKIKKL